MKPKTPNVLPEYSGTYENQGFVYWVCPDGHFYKNQEFSAVHSACPECGEISDRRNYNHPYNLFFSDSDESIAEYENSEYDDYSDWYMEQ